MLCSDWSEGIDYFPTTIPSTPLTLKNTSSLYNIQEELNMHYMQIYIFLFYLNIF